MHISKVILSVLVKVFFKIYFFIFDSPEQDKTSTKLHTLYKGDGFTEIFSLIRIWDAPFKEIDKVLPKAGKIIDLGCGDAILSNYLAISSSKRNIVGIEINKSRLKFANKGLENTIFKYGSIVTAKYPHADAFILSHVLHHLSNYKDQEKVIKMCFSKLKKGGKLVIAEISERPILKYWFTYFTDVVTVPILFDNKLLDTNIHYRKVKDWKKLLLNTGFKTVNIDSAHKGKPFSNVVLVAIKK